MNIKRFIWAGIAVFFTFQVLDLLFHGLILGRMYGALKEVWRPDMMSKMWILHVTCLFLSFMFVYIFSKNYEEKGIAEGARYGLIIGLLINVAGMFNQYAVYPIPFSLAIQWFIYAIIEFVICGIVASLIYKSKSDQ